MPFYKIELVRKALTQLNQGNSSGGVKSLRSCLPAEGRAARTAWTTDVQDLALRYGKDEVAIHWHGEGCPFRRFDGRSRVSRKVAREGVDTDKTHISHISLQLGLGTRWSKSFINSLAFRPGSAGIILQHILSPPFPQCNGMNKSKETETEGSISAFDYPLYEDPPPHAHPNALYHPSKRIAKSPQESHSTRL